MAEMAFARLQRTSVRSMPRLRSLISSTASPSTGAVKLGQPEPLSYLVSLPNKGAPQPAQR